MNRKESMRSQGLHTGGRAGLAAVFLGGLVGVSARGTGDSRSARRRNCRGVKGEPGDDTVLIDFGLVPLGVESAKEGKWELATSGVFGFESAMLSAACDSVAELIHFSSREPSLGDSGSIRKASAK